MARDRFLSGPGQVYKRFRNLVFCNLIGQFKLVMVEIYIYIYILYILYIYIYIYIYMWKMLVEKADVYCQFLY